MEEVDSSDYNRRNQLKRKIDDNGLYDNEDDSNDYARSKKKVAPKKKHGPLWSSESGDSDYQPPRDSNKKPSKPAIRFNRDEVKNKYLKIFLSLLV